MAAPSTFRSPGRGYEPKRLARFEIFGVEYSVTNDFSDYGEICADWQTFIDHLESMNVMDAASLKSIIDGTHLSKALGVKPGIWMKPALDVCMEWQLRNPGMTDPEGAIEEVRKRKDLNIPQK